MKWNKSILLMSTFISSVVSATSWDASRNTENGYYFLTKVPENQPQLMVVRTNINHCQDYTLGTSFVYNIETDSESSIECRATIGNKTLFEGSCSLSASAESNLVTIMLPETETALIPSKQITVSNGKHISLHFAGEELSFEVGDLKKQLNSLTSACKYKRDV
ncbi:hypothetical protein AB4393_00985 [Vibrio splendidus]